MKAYNAEFDCTLIVLILFINTSLDMLVHNRSLSISIKIFISFYQQLMSYETSIKWLALYINYIIIITRNTCLAEPRKARGKCTAG